MSHKEGNIKQTSAGEKMSHFSQLYIFYVSNVGGGKDAWVVWVAEKQILSIGEVGLVAYSGTLKGPPDMAATFGIISRKELI